MIKKILVGLGGTQYTDIIIKRSIELAKHHKAELTGITFMNIESIQNIGQLTTGAVAYADKLKRDRVLLTHRHVEEALYKFKNICNDEGIKYTTKMEVGNPFNLLISYSRYHDLTVLALRGLFEYNFMRDPKDILLRFSSEGVRPIIAVAPQYRTIKKVLIAYNGSMESAKSMKRFIQFRLWKDVILKIVCFDMKKTLAAELLNDASEYCKAHSYIAEIENIKDSPEKGLLRHAIEWDADIIVMGNSSKKSFMHNRLGSTTLEVIQNSDRALFLCQ